MEAPSGGAVTTRTGRASLASRCSLVSFSRLSRLQLLAFWHRLYPASRLMEDQAEFVDRWDKNVRDRG